MAGVSPASQVLQAVERGAVPPSVSPTQSHGLLAHKEWSPSLVPSRLLSGCFVLAVKAAWRVHLSVWCVVL